MEAPRHFPGQHFLFAPPIPPPPNPTMNAELTPNLIATGERPREPVAPTGLVPAATLFQGLVT